MKEIIKDILETVLTVVVVCGIILVGITAMKYVFPDPKLNTDTCCVCKEKQQVITVNKLEEGKETEYKICPQCIIKLIDNQ